MMTMRELARLARIAGSMPAVPPSSSSAPDSTPPTDTVRPLVDTLVALRLVGLSELQLNAVMAYAQAAREMPEEERDHAISAMVRAMGPRPQSPIEDLPDAE